MSVAIEQQDILHLDAYDWDPERQEETPLLSRLATDLLSNGFKDVGPDMVKITISDDALTRYIDSFIVYYYDSTTTAPNEGAFGVGDWTSGDPVTYITDYFYDGNQLKPKVIEDNTYASPTWNDFIAMQLPQSSNSTAWASPMEKTKFLGPNAELFSYLNPHPDNRDADGNWLKRIPPNVAIQTTATSQQGYIGLPRLSQLVYENEFNKIKRLLTNPARNVVAFPDRASGIDTEGNLRHYKEERKPSGAIIHHFWITTYKGEQFFPADVTENETFQGVFNIEFAAGADRVQPDDQYTLTFTGTKLSDNTTLSESVSFIAVAEDIEDFAQEVHNHLLKSNVLSKVSGVFRSLSPDGGIPEGTVTNFEASTQSIDWGLTFTRTARTLLSGLTYSFVNTIIEHGRGQSSSTARRGSLFGGSSPSLNRAYTYTDLAAATAAALDTAISLKYHASRREAVQNSSRGYKESPEDGTTNAIATNHPTGFVTQTMGASNTTFHYDPFRTHGYSVTFGPWDKFPSGNGWPNLDNDITKDKAADMFFLNRDVSVRNCHYQIGAIQSYSYYYGYYNWQVTNADLNFYNYHYTDSIPGYVHSVNVSGFTGANKGDIFTINLTGLVDEDSDTPWENTIDISYSFEAKKPYSTASTLLVDLEAFLESSDCPYTQKYMNIDIVGTELRIEYNEDSSAYMIRNTKYQKYLSSNGDDRAWGLFNAPSNITTRTADQDGENYWIYNDGTIFGNKLIDYYNGNQDLMAANGSLNTITPITNHTATTFLDGTTDPNYVNLANTPKIAYNGAASADTEIDAISNRVDGEIRLSYQKDALAMANVLRLKFDPTFEYSQDPNSPPPIKMVSPLAWYTQSKNRDDEWMNSMYTWDIPDAARFSVTLEVEEETDFDDTGNNGPINFTLTETRAAALSNVGRIRMSFPLARDLGTLANPVRKGSMGVSVGADRATSCNYPVSYHSLVLDDDNSSTRLTRPVGPEVSFDFNLRQLHPNSTHNGINLGNTSYKQFETHTSDLEIDTFEYITDRSMGPLVFETDERTNLGGVDNSQPWRLRLDVSRGEELTETSPYINEGFLQVGSGQTAKGSQFEYLTVHAATEYQLLSNGDVTEVAANSDITQKITKREPGFMGGMRPQYQGYLGATVHKNNPYSQRDLLKGVLANKMNTDAGRVGLYHSTVDGFNSVPDVWTSSNSYSVTYTVGTGTVTNGILDDGEYRYEDSYLLGSSTELLNDTPYNTSNVRVQKGFYRRTGRTGNLAASYPMTYTLTIANHGMVFHIKDHESHTQEGRNAFFCIQRHVDSTTGEPDFTSPTQPVHCIYASSEPPVLYSDLTPFFKTETTGRSNSLAYDGIYDIDGNYVSEFVVDEVVEEDIKAFDLNEQGRFRRFVVREKDILKPWGRHVFAGINERDSHAVINPLEQLSLNDDGQLVIQFPTRIGSYRYLYTGKEIDLIGFVDAGAVGEDTILSSDRFSTTGTNDRRRLYRGLGSTNAYGNGMRILFLQGGFGVNTTFISTALLNS